MHKILNIEVRGQCPHRNYRGSGGQCPSVQLHWVPPVNHKKMHWAAGVFTYTKTHQCFQRPHRGPSPLWDSHPPWDCPGKVLQVNKEARSSKTVRRRKRYPKYMKSCWNTWRCWSFLFVTCVTVVYFYSAPTIVVLTSSQFEHLGLVFVIRTKTSQPLCTRRWTDQPFFTFLMNYMGSEAYSAYKRTKKMQPK